MQQAKIFLADERCVTETKWFRSYNTFNFGNYYSVHKIPVEKLYVCNDDTLAGEKNFAMRIDETTTVLLLPVVGAIACTINNEDAVLINSGEIYCSTLQKNDVFKITNPYADELVNFLQWWVKAETVTAQQLLSFNADENKNTLIHFPFALPVAIAKFDGRKELVYTPTKPNNCVFAFVIQGAFEMEGILLHARDGVAFWNYKHAEMEALSNDAIIVLLEMGTD